MLKHSLSRTTLRHLSYTVKRLPFRPPHFARINRNRLGSRFVHVIGNSRSVMSVAPVQADESGLQSEVPKRVQVEAHKNIGGPLMEKFVPITRQALVSRLGQEEEMLTVEERNGLGKFAAALDAFISRRFYAQLERMKVS